MADRRPIPVTVISGFLGAGKTTLLNRLLTEAHGLRLAVIVNDFGHIPVDVDLIDGPKDGTFELSNGCVCCTVQNDLITVLAELGKRAEPPDHVVIEASGIADPSNLVDVLGSSFFDPPFPLTAVVAIVDAEQVLDQAEDWGAGVLRRQLGAADIVLLNKTDLVEGDRLAEVRAWLATAAPAAPVIETERARVPSELVLLSEPELRPKDGSRVEEAAPLDHGHGFGSFSFTSSRPFDMPAFEAAVGHLPSDVVRAKGVLHTTEQPERRTVFHKVGARVAFEDGGPWGSIPRVSRLVFIGPPQAVDPTALRELLDGALAPA